MEEPKSGSLNHCTSLNECSNECSAAWKQYLCALNQLCLAGSKLARAIYKLEQCNAGDEKVIRTGEKASPPSSYMINGWQNLTRATATATATVEARIRTLLQDIVSLSSVQPMAINGDMDQKRIRELIILENAQTVINVQHQFCVASCDAFISLTCCLVCESPVGFPHDQECPIIKPGIQIEQRSQTPSPLFGFYKVDPVKASCSAEKFPQSACASELSHDDQQKKILCDNLAMQAVFENTRGPLPNPSHLFCMEMPIYRSVRSPFSFDLFPLVGQRRWSEAAAGEIDNSATDPESQMRRWSMPWEASKRDQNTVTWAQTRIMPQHPFMPLPHQKISNSDHFSSGTMDTASQSDLLASQDGLAEAIQLLSLRPAKMPQHFS